MAKPGFVKVEIIRSAGRLCLGVNDRIVAGPWSGQGTVTETFHVRLRELKAAVAAIDAAADKGGK